MGVPSPALWTRNLRLPPRRVILLTELATKMTERVSVATDGGHANNYSFQPAISAHGQYVSFTLPRRT